MTFSYTLTGQRQTMTDGSGPTSYAYDDQNRLVSKTASAGKLSYTYDAVGDRLTAVSSNAGGTDTLYLRRARPVADGRGQGRRRKREPGHLHLRRSRESDLGSIAERCDGHAGLRHNVPCEEPGGDERGDGGAGPVEEQFLAGAVLLAQHHVLPLLPSAIELAEAAVTVAVGMVFAVLLPEQFQGEFAMLLALLAKGAEIRRRTLRRFAGRRLGRKQRGGDLRQGVPDKPGGEKRLFPPSGVFEEIETIRPLGSDLSEIPENQGLKRPDLFGTERWFFR